MMQRCKWRKFATERNRSFFSFVFCLTNFSPFLDTSYIPFDSLAMSMAGEGEEKTDAGLDPAFVNQLLGSLPGVNPDDPAIQEALRKAKDESEKKGDEKEDK